MLRPHPALEIDQQARPRSEWNFQGCDYRRPPEPSRVEGGHESDTAPMYWASVPQDRRGKNRIAIATHALERLWRCRNWTYAQLGPA